MQRTAEWWWRWIKQHHSGPRAVVMARKSQGLGKPQPAEAAVQGAVGQTLPPWLSAPGCPLMGAACSVLQPRVRLDMAKPTLLSCLGWAGNALPGALNSGPEGQAGSDGAFLPARRGAEHPVSCQLSVT